MIFFKRDFWEILYERIRFSIAKNSIYFYSATILYAKKWYLFHMYNNCCNYWYRIPQPPLQRSWACIAGFENDTDSINQMNEEYVILTHKNNIDDCDDCDDCHKSDNIILDEQNKNIIELFLESKTQRFVKEKMMFVVKLNNLYLIKKGKMRNVSPLISYLHSYYVPNLYSKSGVEFLVIEYHSKKLKEPIPIQLKNMNFAAESEILTPIFIYYYFKYKFGEAKTKEIYDENYTLFILDKNMKYMEFDKTKYIYVAKNTYMVIKNI